MRAFNVGDFVLVFLPTLQDKLQNQPFLITEIIIPVTYQVDLGANIKSHRTFHVNAMRKWNSPQHVCSWQMTWMTWEVGKKKLAHPHTSLTSTTGSWDNLKDVQQDIPRKTSLVQRAIPTGEAVHILVST